MRKYEPIRIVLTPINICIFIEEHQSHKLQIINQLNRALNFGYYIYTCIHWLLDVTSTEGKKDILSFFFGELFPLKPQEKGERECITIEQSTDPGSDLGKHSLFYLKCHCRLLFYNCRVYNGDIDYLIEIITIT